MTFFTRLQKIFTSAWLFLVFSALFASSVSASEVAKVAAVAAEPVFVVRADSGTVISRMAGTDKISVGVVGKDGIFVADRGVPAGTHTFVFEHANAQEPCRIEGVCLRGGEATTLVPVMKMRTGELMVTCLPADVALFVDGELKGQGALMLGSLPVDREISVEARSSVYGVQTRRVKVRSGETVKVHFDLRGNIPAQKPDGKIVLPEVPLVLALQKDAVVRVDGVPAKLTDGALTELTVGSRVVEILLPLEGQLVSVWRGALAARSAIMPGADLPAVAMEAPPAEVAEADKKSEVAATGESVPAIAREVHGKVEMALNRSRFQISTTDKFPVQNGVTCKLVVALDVEPLVVRVVTATSNGALVSLEKSPEGYELKEGVTFVLEPNE